MDIDATDITVDLADYISGALDRSLPDTAIEKTKHHLLDTLAAMISGARLPAGRVAIPFVRAEGGTEEATVIGADFLTTATNAAFANAMSGHADETDDTHQRGRLHPGASIVPAALAIAESQGRGGAALLRAIALGYDIGVRVNLSLGEAFLQDGGHSTHAVGAQFGATAAAAALLGLDPGQTRVALSYCIQQAAGCPYYVRDKGHIEKAFDFNGMAARNGVAAAVMVAHGFTGVDDPFNSPFGFFDIFTDDPAPAKLTEALGSRFEIMDGHIKKWTTGNPNQTAIECLLTIISEHGIGPEDVERIAVELPRRRFYIANNSPMPDICMQHLLSVLLIDGTLSFASTHDAARMEDPAVLALREKFDLSINPELDTLHPMRPSIVTVLTKDGRELTHRMDAAPGTPENPMTRDEIAAKAHDLCAPVIGDARSHALIDAVYAIDGAETLAPLRPLLQAEGGRP